MPPLAAFLLILAVPALVWWINLMIDIAVDAFALQPLLDDDSFVGLYDLVTGIRRYLGAALILAGGLVAGPHR